MADAVLLGGDDERSERVVDRNESGRYVLGARHSETGDLLSRVNGQKE